MCWKRNALFGAVIALTAWSPVSTGWAQEHPDEQALIKALAGAKVSLQQGLAASEREGRPISGKFEVEDGKLQLSVYTTKDGKYFEVVVDYTTGAVAKTEPITEGDDLADAKSQTEAMTKGKVQLKDAVEQAVGQTPGSRAVSVEPELKNGHVTATIALLAGGKIQTVTRQLD
jgi:hypothetical protein